MADETNGNAAQSAHGQPVPPPERKGFLGKVDRFFGITASGSDFKREIVAGLTTFMAMVYILMVNAGMFSEDWVGVSYGAAYIATAIGAISGTLLMAFLAKMPLAQASGMGINAFIVYTLLLNGSGLTYANCMMFTLLDGVVLVILTATGLRKKIFEAIPAAVRLAIPVGIGLFIAFIGFQQAGVIVADSFTLVKFVSFNVFADGFGYGAIVPALVCLIGVIAIAVLSHKDVKGAIFWGILGSAALFYLLSGVGCAWGDRVCVKVFTDIKETFRFNPFAAFADWGKESVGQVFVKGFDFSGYTGGAGGLALVIVTSTLSLCMINIFDTIGALYGACARGNLLDGNGAPLRMQRMMMTDAVATCVGAVAGTSSLSTFVESSSGVAAGGKTGFTALTTAVLFFVAMFLSPIAKLIPRCATAAALVWVGVLMMSSVAKIEWTDAAEALVAFLIFVVMALGYSIAKGIGVGIIAYVLVKVCTGKFKEITLPTWIVFVLFLAMFVLT